MENKTAQFLQAEIMRTRTAMESALEDINLLNTDIIAIQGDLTALSDTVAQQNDKITEAAQKADTAQNTANGALFTADSALSVASEANDTAETAQNTANTAQEVAMSKYTKPVDGIPEADLSEDVQSKLNDISGDYVPTSFKINGIAIDEYTGVVLRGTTIYKHVIVLNSSAQTTYKSKFIIYTDYINEITTLNEFRQFFGLVELGYNHIFNIYFCEEYTDTNNIDVLYRTQQVGYIVGADPVLLRTLIAVKHDDTKLNILFTRMVFDGDTVTEVNNLSTGWMSN